MPRSTKTPPAFEAAMQELEQLVATLEQGDLPLEESLKTFERGVELARSCQQALRDAEQKVEILTAKSADAPTAPFASDD